MSFLSLVLLTGLPLVVHHVPQANGVPVIQMNRFGGSYADPEIHPTENEMVFQDNDEVWLGALNPVTGLFVTLTGRDRFVDTASSLLQAKNGPEYGWDEDGLSIFYNKNAGPQLLRVWRATETDNGFDTTPITGLDASRINPLVSQGGNNLSTYLLYARPNAGGGGEISWLDEASPNDEFPITLLRQSYAGFRWLRNSAYYTSTQSVGPNEGEIILGNAEAGTQNIVTADDQLKFDPYAWYPPEFEGDMAILAAVNEGQDIAIYRETDSVFFEQVATLSPPAQTQMRYVQSAEPFIAGNRSYISLTLKDNPGSVYTDVNESEIWIYGIQDGAQRFVQRCDDGAPGKIRHEAETFKGTFQTMLYYNELIRGPEPELDQFDLYLCRTGLPPAR